MIPEGYVYPPISEIPDWFPKDKKAAIAMGSKRFFSGIPCIRGHVHYRATSHGGCFPCTYMLHNRHYVPRVRKKSIRDIAKEHRSAGLKTFVSDFPCAHGHGNIRRTIDAKCVECVRIKQKKTNERRREYTQQHIKKWKKKNPDKVGHYDKERKEKIKSSGHFTGKDVKRLLLEQNWLCVYCSKDLCDDYHVDHIMPLFLGGSDDAENIQILCPPCNLKKGPKHPLVFEKEIGFLRP